MLKFYRCPKCGNLVELIEDGKSPMICCGEPMKELKANTTDAATEKHVPVVNETEQGIFVTVGSVPHPMIPEHYIQWIVLVTSDGVKRHMLQPGESPQAVFCKSGKVLEAYEYCNLHGLWKLEL